MGDINKVTLVGVAVTRPSFVDISSKTPMIIFTLRLKETWKNRQGVKQEKGNLINIEVVGRNAMNAKDIVKVGRRYHIDGYLRTDTIKGREETRVRTFHIEKDDIEDYEEGLYEGLNRAYALLDNSETLEVAKAKLELLLPTR